MKRDGVMNILNRFVKNIKNVKTRERVATILLYIILIPLSISLFIWLCLTIIANFLDIITLLIMSIGSIFYGRFKFNFFVQQLKNKLRSMTFGTF
jgi:hypothetical protein